MIKKNNSWSEPSKIISLFFFLLILCGIFVAGFWPFNFYPLNEIHRQTDSTGTYLSIKQPSLAYITPELPNFNSPDGFTIKIKLKSKNPSTNYIARIFSLTSNNKEILMIGQWKSGIIFRYYDPAKSRNREIYLKKLLESKAPFLLTLIVTRSSFLAFYNGENILKREVSLQQTSLKGFATVGNSNTGKQGWTGELYELRIYDHPIDDNQIMCRTNESQKLFSFPNEVCRLVIPKHFSAIKKMILTPPWVDFRFNKSYINDVVLNFIGFLPLGFMLGVLLMQYRIDRFNPLLISFLLCTAISLSIELIQPFIPSRCSQLSDLILNVLGAISGTWIFLIFKKR
ncbi:MAG TPA: VanZ family protein [Chitinispirillaceae bacterium]|nr:VanZ family protein [Chitinispirillaceae bacterium]